MSYEWRGEPKPGFFQSWWDVLIFLLICMSGYAAAWAFWEIVKVWLKRTI